MPNDVQLMPLQACPTFGIFAPAIGLFPEKRLRKIANGLCGTAISMVRNFKNVQELVSVLFRELMQADVYCRPPGASYEQGICATQGT